MKIAGDDDYWQSVGGHTSATNGSAPWPVQIQVAALLGDARIEGSAVRFEPDSPSRWTIHLVTEDARLIVVEMAIDSERYDSEAEQIRLQDNEPEPGISVRVARVRRLSDASHLDFGALGNRVGAFGNLRPEEYSVAGIGVGFTDGSVVQVDFFHHPHSAGANREEQRADAFIAALRRHTNL